MKTGLLLFLLLSANPRLLSQNEFAGKAFYDDFNTVCEDALKGFSSLRNNERINESPGLLKEKEYEIKRLLPLADSGKIVFPEGRKPYAVFYFEPSKSRLKIDQKGANLKEAISIAYGQTLSALTETVLIEDNPVSNTWFFSGTEEKPRAEALFVISVYYKTGQYYLSLQINGI